MFKKCYLIFLILLLISFSYAKVYCVKISESKDIESLNKLKEFVIKTGIDSKNLFIKRNGDKYELLAGYKSSFKSMIPLYKRIKSYFYTAYITTCDINTKQKENICHYFNIENPLKINLTYMKNQKNLLHLYKNQTDFFESIIKNFKNVNLTFESKGFNLTDINKSILKKELEVNDRKFNFIGGFSYYSNNFIPDDVSYPYNWSGYIGIDIPLFKNGILENSWKEKYYKYLIKLNNLKVYTPSQNILNIYKNSISLMEKYKNSINYYQYKFLNSIQKHLKQLSKFDKYYQGILNRISYTSVLDTNNQYVKPKLFKICNLDTSYIKSLLSKKRKEIVKNINSIKLNEENNFIHKFIDVDTRVRFTFNYRNSPVNLNNDYLRADILFTVPFPNKSKQLKDIENLKLMDEKLKVLNDFDTYEAVIESELLNFEQNYIIYKEHLLNYKESLFNLKNNYLSIKLGVRELDIEKFIQNINSLYKELKILTIYQNKLLISLNKIQIYLSSIDKNFKLKCSNGSRKKL